MTIDYEKAKELAKWYLAQNPPGHPDYVWILSEGKECKTGWYFDFTFKCLKPVPKHEWESFAGAPGFVVSRRDGKIQNICADEYAENDF